MEDSGIIDLYWQRDESAISETDRKYGVYCRTIAMNILSIHEDAEECISDTYSRAWNVIPPQRPNVLRTFLGRIIRNLSIDCWRHNHAKKHYNGIEQLLSELEDCIPSPSIVEHEVEANELINHINNWLSTLTSDNRILFMRRYWYGEALNSLAKECGVNPSRLAQRMYQLRTSLKSALEKEGITV